MRDADGQRLQLKSKLLVGAAGMTAVAMSTAAFAADAAPPPSADASNAPAPVAAPAATPAQAMAPIDPPKWLPYVDIGGGVGSGFTIGRVNAFVPFWQDIDSLAFVRFGANTRTHYSNNFNIGAGYRTKIDGEWILGAFAGFDSSQTDYNHTFNQFSLGLEAMSADWDLRANAYFAKKTNRTLDNKFELYIHDTAIAILQAQEAGMSGFDGEVGYRVFNTDSTDVRVFAGAYTFHHPDVNSAGIGTNFSLPYRDVTGPKVRAEVNVFDLDMLGSQSRFSVEGQVSHDNVNHTSEYIGATLRIALNDPSGSGAQALDDLDRRMADPVRRQDNVLTQWQFNKPEPVIIYNGKITSEPTNTLFYAEQRSSAATGSYADQTTIQDATSRGAGKNAFIVLTDSGGSTIDATGTTVHSGETLTGAGTFKVRGETHPSLVFTHDFAPGSGPVSLTATSGNVLNITGDVNIAGLSIAGPFVDGIYGTNVGNVTIANVDITGPGTNGIVFEQTDPSGTSNIVIKNSSIKGVTNDGIDLDVNATSGATSTTNLIGKKLRIHAGHDGVSLDASSSGGSYATVYVGIHNSSIAAGNTGLYANATTSGGTLTQTVVVDPSVISGGDYGVYIHGDAITGTLVQKFTDTDGSIHGSFSVYGEAHGGSLTQNVTAAHLVLPASHEPLFIGAYADGGSVMQKVNLSDVTADNGAYDNIDISAHAFYNATINQHVSLSGVQASDSGGDGIYISAYAGYGAATLQTVSISGLTADGNGGDGIYISAHAGYDATTLQTVGISSLTADNNGNDGLFAIVHGYSPTAYGPSVAAQYLSIDGASFSGNAGTGVVAEAEAFGNAVTRQDVLVTGSQVSNNGFYGVEIFATAFTGASVQQYLLAAGDTADGNGESGLFAEASANGQGFTAQTLELYASSFDYNGNDGIDITGFAGSGGDAEQNAGLYFVSAQHNSGTGLNITSFSYGYTYGSYTYYLSHVQQNVIAAYDTFSHNGRYGVRIDDEARFGGGVDQLVEIYDSHLDGNGREGLRASLFADGYGGSGAIVTHLYSDLYVIGSTADANVYDGMDISGEAIGPTYLIQHIYAGGSEFDGNGRAGLYAGAIATDIYSLNIQYITLAGSSFDGNGLYGARFVAEQIYGPLAFGAAIQDVAISGSDFSYNTYDGLSAETVAFLLQGRAEQHFTIGNSRFDYNGRNGMRVFNEAVSGTYLAGYPCTAVQGLYGGCAFARQTVDIAGSDISHNGFDGIYLTNEAVGYGAVYDAGGRPHEPTLYIQNSNISDNGQNGIQLTNIAVTGSYIFQSVGIVGSTVDGNGAYGIVVENIAENNSAIYQTIGVTDSTVDGNGRDGIRILNEAVTDSLVYQITGVIGSTVNSNGGDGISIANEAAGSSGIYQVVGVVDSSVNGNAENGFYSFNYAGGGSETFQLILAYSYAGANSISSNGYSGIEVDSFAGYNGLVVNYDEVSGTLFDSNAYAGIVAQNFAYSAGASAVSYVQAYGNTISGSTTGLGLFARGPGAYQMAYIGYNTFSGNTTGVKGAVTGGGFQYIDLHYGNTHNGDTANYSFYQQPGSTQIIVY
ncbi:MAG TPA: inverse autotransporter beta domain-containing protein [Rhizomicrobium sp.]